MIHKGSFLLVAHCDDVWCDGECGQDRSRTYSGLAAMLADGHAWQCTNCGRLVDDDAMRFGASDDLDDDRPMDPCCAVTKDGALRDVYCSTACHDAWEAPNENHP
jgi:hypothetical protein